MTVIRAARGAPWSFAGRRRSGDMRGLCRSHASLKHCILDGMPRKIVVRHFERRTLFKDNQVKGFAADAEECVH